MVSDKTSNDNFAARSLSPLAKALAGSKHYYGSSRNHGAFVKIEDLKMLKFRRIV